MRQLRETVINERKCQVQGLLFYLTGSLDIDIDVCGVVLKMSSTLEPQLRGLFHPRFPRLQCVLPHIIPRSNHYCRCNSDVQLSFNHGTHSLLLPRPQLAGDTPTLADTRAEYTSCTNAAGSSSSPTPYCASSQLWSRR